MDVCSFRSLSFCVYLWIPPQDTTKTMCYRFARHNTDEHFLLFKMVDVTSEATFPHYNCYVIIFSDSFINFIYILVCDPGYYWQHTELRCIICPRGTFSPTGHFCVRCPFGEDTSHEGSTSPADCL